MQRETILLGAAALVILAAVAGAAAVPGARADLDGPAPPGFLEIREVAIAPGPVSGESATLAVETRLTHRRGPSENVTVLLRAIDAESGLVETSRELDVGTVEGEREVAVRGNLSVSREGGYRIRTVVFEDGRRVAQETTVVRGVGSLQPAYARTTVGFHRFGESGAALPSIEYAIASAAGNRTTLRVQTYLTNAGDAPAGGLTLVLKARQADSNIVADETTVDVGGIAPGTTATPTAEVTVPDGYNYYLDAVLWKGDVVVGTARAAANLDPTETLSVNETRRRIGLEVGEFATTEAVSAERTVVRTPMATAAPGGQPGFTAALAVAAALAALLLLRRRST